MAHSVEDGGRELASSTWAAVWRAATARLAETSTRRRRCEEGGQRLLVRTTQGLR